MAPHIACRASLPLRSLAGAGAVTAPLRALLPRTRQRQQRRGLKDRLDGPFGQQAPPKKPGGPDAIRRNWVPIGGAVLLAAAVMAYVTRDGGIDSAAAAARDNKQQGSKALGELSGKNSKTGLGAFRSD